MLLAIAALNVHPVPCVDVLSIAGATKIVRHRSEAPLAVKRTSMTTLSVRPLPSFSVCPVVAVDVLVQELLPPSNRACR